jgi:ionotropic glutamate receptor
MSQRSDQRIANTTYWSPTHNWNTVIWPGESIEVPRGWEIPIDGKKLQVGIVIGGGFPKYIDANEDSLTGVAKESGLAIEIFEEAVKRLPYALPYEYIVFNTTGNVSSSYDDFVYQVYLKVTHTLHVYLFKSKVYSRKNALPRSDISYHGLMVSLQIKQTTSVI